MSAAGAGQFRSRARHGECIADLTGACQTVADPNLPSNPMGCLALHTRGCRGQGVGARAVRGGGGFRVPGVGLRFEWPKGQPHSELPSEHV